MNNKQYSLEEKRLTYSVIQIYQTELKFSIATETRSHGFRLYKSQPNLESRKHFYNIEIKIDTNGTDSRIYRLILQEYITLKRNWISIRLLLEGVNRTHLDGLKSQ